jgi:hypothetical protein
MHIPKCAGTSIGTALDPIASFPLKSFAENLGKNIEDTANALSDFGFEHDTLGKMHQMHIPLSYLESDFPNTLQLLKEAKNSFAILRDPRDRFISAIFQNLREFEHMGASDITEDIIREKAEHVCDWLSRRDRFCDLEYIHFTRQVDYLKLDETFLVKKLFALEHMHEVEEWLSVNFGTAPFLGAPQNQSHKPKKWFSKVQPIVRYSARTLLPSRVREAIFPLWIKSGLYEKASLGYSKVDLGDKVDSFIDEFYLEDMRLRATLIK